jgi:hypothetical protein
MNKKIKARWYCLQKKVTNKYNLGDIVQVKNDNLEAYWKITSMKILSNTNEVAYTLTSVSNGIMGSMGLVAENNIIPCYLDLGMYDTPDCDKYPDNT